MRIIQICLCFFIVYTLLKELLPTGPFRKYMKFMGGLIFILLFFQNLFQMESELPVLYKNYYRRAQADLQDDYGKKILYEEYEEQMESQIEELLEQDGYEPVTISVQLEEQELKSISVKLKHADQYDEIQIKNKLREVYSLEESHINIKS
ncbi:MAG: stage III sporulation protein AF [Lachnospiraceae bacterium]|nr:stage III sporulation protein AF [Lachnospiraceae bacterium]